MKLSRRQLLKTMGAGSLGLALVGCAAPAAPAAEGESAGPGAAATELTIWFHWGGAAGERAQELNRQLQRPMAARPTTSMCRSKPYPALSIARR